MPGWPTTPGALDPALQLGHAHETVQEGVVERRFQPWSGEDGCQPEEGGHGAGTGDAVADLHVARGQRRGPVDDDAGSARSSIAGDGHLGPGLNSVQPVEEPGGPVGRDGSGPGGQRRRHDALPHRRFAARYHVDAGIAPARGGRRAAGSPPDARRRPQRQVVAG